MASSGAKGFAKNIRIQNAKRHAPYTDGSRDVHVIDEELGIVVLMRMLPTGELRPLEEVL